MTLPTGDNPMPTMTDIQASNHVTRHREASDFWVVFVVAVCSGLIGASIMRLIAS